MWWAIICTRQSRLSFDAEDLQKVLRLKERRCGDVGWQLARGLLVKEGPPLIVCKHQVSQGVRVPVQRVLRSCQLFRLMTPLPGLDAIIPAVGRAAAGEPILVRLRLDDAAALAVAALDAPWLRRPRRLAWAKLEPLVVQPRLVSLPHRCGEELLRPEHVAREWKKAAIAQKWLLHIELVATHSADAVLRTVLRLGRSCQRGRRPISCGSAQ